MDISPLRQKLINERNLDISYLVSGTVENVLQKRMEETHVGSVLEYARYLDDFPDEYQACLREILVLPDRFFGDATLDFLLDSRLIPDILARKKRDDRIAIWIPNCRNGYLAYEVAAYLWKYLSHEISSYKVLVLGTDTSSETIRAARALSTMPETKKALANLGGPFDTRIEQPMDSSAFKRMIIFGVHDPVTQPPYPRLDLIICRGYLPLLDAPDRDTVKAKFIHALVMKGNLILGRGELIGMQEEEPSPNKPFPLFSKQVAHPFELQLPTVTGQEITKDHLVFLDGLPYPAIVIAPDGEIIYANQPADKALADGRMLKGRNVSVMDSFKLSQSLMSAIDQARKDNKPLLLDDIDGFTGALAPLKDGNDIAVLIPARVRKDNSEKCREEWVVLRKEMALQIVKAASDMHEYNYDIKRLREQSALITEHLYARGEELDRIRTELETRNTELSLLTDDLRNTLADRENAERRIRQAYEREHRIAATLQGALLSPMPTRIAGYEVATRYTAAHEEADIGGDFFRGGWVRDGKYHVLLGDVSGKGLDAAVYAYMATYMSLGFTSEISEPAEVLTRLNDALSSYGEYGQFITLVFLLLDPSSNRIYYSSAGHEPMILCTRDGKVVCLDPTNIVLGINSGIKYSSRYFEMSPGDLVILYTDGLSDAGPRTDMLGVKGLSEILCNNRNEPLSTILDNIYSTALRISNGKLADDAASVLIRRLD